MLLREVSWLPPPSEQLPDATAADQATRSARLPRTNFGARILVVDDDPGILSMVSDFLDMEGYVVHTATNGAEALALVECTAPRVILLDMRMPVLDGWGVARALKARGEQLPVLVMTAAINARRWAAEIGAAGYVSKPFDLACLLGTVQRLLLVN
jgi:two-component system chemotaxis response regulator CheY